MDQKIQQLVELTAELPIIQKEGLSLFCRVPIRYLTGKDGIEVPPLEEDLPVVICRGDQVLFFLCFTSFDAGSYQKTKAFYDENLPGLERLFLEDSRFHPENDAFKAQVIRELSAFSEKLIAQVKPSYQLKAEPIRAQLQGLGLSGDQALSALTSARLLTITENEERQNYAIAEFGTANGLVWNLAAPLPGSVGDADTILDHLWVAAGGVPLADALRFNASERKRVRGEKVSLEDRITRLRQYRPGSPEDGRQLCRSVREYLERSVEDYCAPCPEILPDILQAHPEAETFSTAELIRFAVGPGEDLLFDSCYPMIQEFARGPSRRGSSMPRMPAYLVFYAAAVRMDSVYPLWKFQRNLESWRGTKRQEGGPPAYGDLLLSAYRDNNAQEIYDLLTIPLEPFYA